MVTREITLADSEESRRYNRIKRWLGIADFALGFGLLVVLLATGWTGTLRDLAERGAGASQNYSFAVFLYVLMLMLISKVLGTPLEYYGFRWSTAITSPTRSFAPGSGRMQELSDRLGHGRDSGGTALHADAPVPQHWWLIAWAVFLGLMVLLAQIAPVVLFPISTNLNHWKTKNSSVA